MRKPVAYSPLISKDPVAYSPLISKDMGDSWAVSLIREVRYYRYCGFEPTLYLTQDELERLAAFWPGFYLVSTAAVPSSGGLIARLRRLFRTKAKTKVTVCACDNALNSLSNG